jgi:hypothetical protein
MSQPSRAKYLGTEQGNNLFELHCSCGTVGVAHVPTNDRSTFACPCGCGVTWLQWHDPIAGKPGLVCVVDHVYLEGDDDE